MQPRLMRTLMEFLDNLTYDYPHLAWELDEDSQIVVWEEDHNG